MWAGADPRSRGPALDDADHMDEARRRHTDVERLWRGGERGVVSYSLELGASPNDKPNRGSTVLDGLIRRLEWEYMDDILPLSNSRFVTAGLLGKGRL
jgi:hypothetical protein